MQRKAMNLFLCCGIFGVASHWQRWAFAGCVFYDGIIKDMQIEEKITDQAMLLFFGWILKSKMKQKQRFDW